jgi:hypothetical protein
MQIINHYCELKGSGSNYISAFFYTLSRLLPAKHRLYTNYKGRSPIDFMKRMGLCPRVVSSEPRTRLFQKLGFLIGRFPAQDAVPVRIAAEPFNDCFVLQFEIEAVLVAIVPEQLGGDLMHLQRLAVHERHVEEASLGLFQ